MKAERDHGKAVALLLEIKVANCWYRRVVRRENGPCNTCVVLQRVAECFTIPSVFFTAFFQYLHFFVQIFQKGMLLLFSIFGGKPEGKCDTFTP